MQIGEESTRQRKVARQIQKDLSEFFLTHASELCGGNMVSVTKVRISSDLKYAHIFISIFPAPNPAQAIENIRSHTREIRFQLGKLIGKQLRAIPELTFQLDDNLDHIQRIEELIQNDPAKSPADSLEQSPL